MMMKRTKMRSLILLKTELLHLLPFCLLHLEFLLLRLARRGVAKMPRLKTPLEKRVMQTRPTKLY